MPATCCRTRSRRSWAACADADPMPPRQLRDVVDAGWGRDWMHRFESFDVPPLRRNRSVRSTGPHEGRVRTHLENPESGHLGAATANHPRHLRHRHGFAPAGPVLRFRCPRLCRRLCHIGLGVGLPGIWHMFRRPRRCWSSVRSREPIFALPVCALVLPVADISCNGPCCGADWPGRSFAAPAKLQGVASRVLV